MQKYPLTFGTKADSELFLFDMVKKFVIFKPKIGFYNLV